MMPPHFSACIFDFDGVIIHSEPLHAEAQRLARLAGADPGPSGQVAFGQVTVEPAYDDVTGDLIYLLTPDHAPFPSRANARATAPMYLVMYPQGSTVALLNCLPTNCDHVEVVPSGLVEGLGLQSVYPIGTISTKYGSFTGGLVLGHDHLVGVARSHGDFNVAWDVDLVLFTPKGVSDGAINQPLRTLQAVNAAIANGTPNRTFISPPALRPRKR